MRLSPGVALGCLALLAAAGAPPALRAQSGGTDRARRALLAAADRFATLRGLCAGFEQHLTVPLLDEERTSRGRLCQLRPNLFRMDFEDPAGDRIVADGTYFWLYYRSLNPGQVIRLDLDPDRGGLDFYREFLEDPATKYDVLDQGAETVSGARTRKIRLTPRTPRGYRSAIVWIDPGARLIRRIEVEEENGTVRRITLEDITVDPDLPADFFRFSIPPGVQVVTGAP